MARQVVIGVVIEGKDSSSAALQKVSRAFKASFRVVQGGARKMGKALRRAAARGRMAFQKLKQSVGSLKGAMVGLVAIVGIAGLGAVFKKLTALAGVQEKSITALGSAFATQLGPGARQATKDFGEFASALQQQTGIGDEVLNQTAALGLRLGVAASEIQNFTKLAVDMTAVQGSLQGNSRILARALEGDTAALRSLNIQIDNNLPKAQRAEEAVKALNAQFGGAAQAAIQTYGGRAELAGANLGDLGEKAGFVFTQNKLLNALVVELGNAFVKLGDIIDQNRVFLDNLVTGGIRLVFDAIDAIINIIGRVIITFNLLKAAAFAVFGALLSQVELVVKGFSFLVDSLFSGINKIRRLLGKAPILNPLAKSLGGVTRLIGGMRRAANEMTTEFIQKATDVETSVEGIRAKFRGWQATVEETAKTIQVGGTQIVGKMVEVKTAVAAVEAKLKATKAAGTDAASKLGDAFSTVFQQITQEGKSLDEALTGVFRSMAQSLIQDFIKKATTALLNKALTGISANAAEGASAGAANAATLPPPAGFILPPIIAASMFALILGFQKKIKKFERGGIVGAPNSGLSGPDSTLVAAQTGEGFLPVGLTRALRRVLSVRAQPPVAASTMVPRFQGGGVVGGQSSGDRVVRVTVKQETVGLPDRATSRRWLRDTLGPEITTLVQQGQILIPRPV